MSTQSGDADEARQSRREAKVALALLILATVLFLTLTLVRLVEGGHPDNATLGLGGAFLSVL